MSSINNSKLDDNYELLEDLPRTTWNSIFKTEKFFQIDLAAGFGAGFSKHCPTIWAILYAWGIWMIFYQLLSSSLSSSFTNKIYFLVVNKFFPTKNKDYSFTTSTYPTFIVWIIGFLIFVFLFYYCCLACDRAIKHFNIENPNFIVLDKIWGFLFVLFVASISWPINYTGYSGRFTYFTQIFSLGIIAQSILFIIYIIFDYFKIINFNRLIDKPSSNSNRILKLKTGFCIMLNGFTCAILTLIVWGISVFIYLY